MSTYIFSEEGVSWQFRTRQRFRCRGCEVVFSSAASLTNHRCVRTTETPKSEAVSSRGRQGRKGSRRSGEPVTPVPSTSGKKTGPRKGSQHQHQHQQLPSGKPLPKLKAEVDSSDESSDSEELEVLSLSPQRRSPRSSPRGRGSVYACDICKKVFLSPGKLKQHSYSHTGERPFSCTLCHKAFSSRFKLVRHQLIHTTERQHQCPRCERSFHRKDHLKNHIQIHEPNKQYKCEKVDCGKEYNSFMSYRKHCAVHAAEEGDLQCKICQKMFETKPDLIYHLKVHVGSRSVKSPSEKKFQCDHCDRRFFTRKDVKRHLVVHTGKRDFSCTICPQKFGRKDHLVRHIKKSHGIADLSRMEGLEYSATPSSAPQALSPNLSVTSSSPSTSSTHPLPMVALPEPVAGPSGLSGSAGLLEQGETFITPFQEDLFEAVKEEPELQPSMEEISPGGDDLSKILGMYLPSGSINLPGPSLLDPASSRGDEGESQRSQLDSVLLRLMPEDHKESVLQNFPQESTEPRGLITASPREEYNPEGIMSVGLLSSESSGVSPRPLHSPESVSQLSGNGIPVATTTTTTAVVTAATPATSTASSVSVTRAASQFSSLPGFDEVFPS